ncbi:uncharacterized protein LOC143067391 [Mytilus galloprovincialis]|uniref:uncharacterized protein LOC143067391 n=1 Tax=Mytilus galloprovincialis TaxID=29158 RepID=UPI003F7B5606
MALFKKSQVYDQNRQKTDDEDVRRSKNKVSTMFTSVLTVMKISGAVLSTDRYCGNKVKYMLHVIFCCIMQLIPIFNAFRFIGAFLSATGELKYHIGIFSFVWFFFLIEYMAIMFLYSSKQLMTFLVTFDEYQCEYGIHFKRKKYKHIIDVITIVFFVEVLITNGLISASFSFNWINRSSLYGMFLWPLQNSTGSTLYFASVMYGILMIEPMVICSSVFLFYFFVLQCIKKEFEHISIRLVQLRKRPTTISTEMEDIRQQHQVIVNILSSVNPVLRHIAGGFYAMGTPVICFMIYGISSGTLLWEDGFKMIGTIVINLVAMFAITFKGASINSMAHQPLEELHNFDMSVLPDKTVHQIVIFTNRLTGPPIGVSVYGLFVIDYSTVLMVFGTIITYAVIAIQFTSTGSPSDNCLYNHTNVTFIT